MASSSGSSALALWTFDPTAVAVALLLTLGYLAGLRRVSGWPLGRTVCFLLGGVGSLLLLTTSWVGVYAHQAFWVYTLQVTTLLVITPMLFALGRPLTMLRQVAPGSRRFLDSSGFRVLSSPLLGPLLVPITLSLVFFTHVLTVTARSDGALQALQVSLLLLGFLFAVPLAGEQENVGSFSLAIALFVGIVELLLDAIPGIVVRLQTHLLAPSVFPRLGDQQHGGAILWFLAEIIDIPFLGLLLLRWIRTDKAEAARIDNELDARAPVTGDPEDELWERPWWEQENEGEPATGQSRF